MSRIVSTTLLRLGTIPFIAVPVVVAFAPKFAVEKWPNLDHSLHVALVCHTGCILAFIGGLQQAAAVAAPSLPHSSWIAGLAIAAAIVGCCAVLATALRGVTPDEPMVLCCAYVAQSVLERCIVPGVMRTAMLHDERTIPMMLASASLVFMARHASGGTAALLSVRSVPICLGLLLVVACVLLLRRSASSSDAAIICPTNARKEKADVPARSRRRGKSPKKHSE